MVSGDRGGDCQQVRSGRGSGLLKRRSPDLFEFLERAAAVLVQRPCLEGRFPKFLQLRRAGPLPQTVLQQRQCAIEVPGLDARSDFLDALIDSRRAFGGRRLIPRTNRELGPLQKLGEDGFSRKALQVLLEHVYRRFELHLGQELLRLSDGRRTASLRRCSANSPSSLFRSSSRAGSEL